MKNMTEENKARLKKSIKEKRKIISRNSIVKK